MRKINKIDIYDHILFTNKYDTEYFVSADTFINDYHQQMLLLTDDDIKLLSDICTNDIIHENTNYKCKCNEYVVIKNKYLYNMIDVFRYEFSTVWIITREMKNTTPIILKISNNILVIISPIIYNKDLQDKYSQYWRLDLI